MEAGERGLQPQLDSHRQTPCLAKEAPLLDAATVRHSPAHLGCRSRKRSRQLPSREEPEAWSEVESAQGLAEMEPTLDLKLLALKPLPSPSQPAPTMRGCQPVFPLESGLSRGLDR